MFSFDSLAKRNGRKDEKRSKKKEKSIKINE